MIQCPNRGQVGSAEMWADLALFVPGQFQMRQLSKIYDWQREVKLIKTVHFFNACELNSMKGQRFWLDHSKSSEMHFLFSALRCFQGVRFHGWPVFSKRDIVGRPMRHRCVWGRSTNVSSPLHASVSRAQLYFVGFYVPPLCIICRVPPNELSCGNTEMHSGKKRNLNQRTEFLVHFANPDSNFKKDVSLMSHYWSSLSLKLIAWQSLLFIS